MALQARVKGQSEWYHPHRDIGHTFDRYLRGALGRLELNKPAEAIPVHLIEAGSKLGRIMVGCVKGDFKSEAELEIQLRSIPDKAMEQIGKEFLTFMFLRYRGFRIDLLPKRPVNEQ